MVRILILSLLLVTACVPAEHESELFNTKIDMQQMRDFVRECKRKYNSSVIRYVWHTDEIVEVVCLQGK